jgi:hypothetical protein
VSKGFVDRVEEQPAILFVIDKMVRGGGPVVCQKLVQSLCGTPYRPCVVTLFGKGKIGEELADAGFPLLSLDICRPFRLRQILNHVPSIVSFARSHRVGLVHAHLTASGLYGGLAARAGCSRHFYYARTVATVSALAHRPDVYRQVI